MANDQLNRLRQQAAAKQRQAGKKISRNATVKDVFISGTEYDPRLPQDKVRRMNSAQLKGYVRRLDQFNNRTTQFVPGARGAPIPAAVWGAFKNAERHVNDARRLALDRIKDIQAPGNDMTIGEQRAADMPKFPTAATAANDPYRPSNRKSTGFTRADFVKKATEDAKRNIRDGGRAKLIAAGREDAMKMLEAVGNGDLAARLSYLSDQQFDILWHNTRFAYSLALEYDTKMKMLARSKGENVQKKARWHEAIIATQSKQATSFVSWAENLDSINPAATPTTGKKGKRK